MKFVDAMRALGLSLAVLAGASASVRAHGDHKHGDHAEKAAYGEPGDPAKPAREVLIVMEDGEGKMLFTPALVEVKQGEQIRFKFRNVGALEHEFIIGTQEELDEHADIMKAMPDMAHDDPNALRLAPKKEGDLVWRFTNAGEFPFACLIPGHREAGMTGKVVVR